jgi:proteasome alpha subunit
MSTEYPYRYPFFYGPEGRLIQVDAALQAVGRGSTTVGIKTDDYVLLASQIRSPRPLTQPPEKIFAVDEHIGATGSGYSGDLTHLIDEARLQAQRYRLSFDSPIDVLSLAKHLGTYLHSYTLYTVRPPGASVILAGADTLGVQLYQIEPGGTYFNGKAAAVGQNSDMAFETISGAYAENLSFEDAVKLATDAIAKAAGDKVSIDLGVVRKTKGVFERIRQQTVAATSG